MIKKKCLTPALLLALAGATFAQDPQPPEETPAEPETFDVWEYRVLGNSMLPGTAVERAVYPHLGPDRELADVEAARGALETAYRDAGYSTVFVDIPEQSVDEGIVRLNVTEGRLDRVRVSGARYFSNRMILAALPALETGEVPYFPDVQRELAALNRATPDRLVTPVLRAGRYPGTVDMELRVQDDLPFHGVIEFNDRYTADTSELRANLNFSYANLWQRAHTLSLQYQVAPQEPNEANVLAATYVTPLEDSDTVVAFYGVDSDSDVATIGTLSVLGKGNIYGVRGILPFDGVGTFFHNMTLGIDFKDFDENIRLTIDDGLRTAIKYVNWSASYGFGWNQPAGATNLSIGAAWGVRGAGNDDTEFEEKRFKARGNYLYAFGSVEHTRPVFGDARFVGRTNWQYTATPLISNEQFSIGGATSVRGYLEAERLGDAGASLSLELYTPPLLAARSVISEFRFFGFYDVGRVFIHEPLPSQIEESRLESAGVGVHFRGFGGFDAGIDWAQVLRDGANVLEDEDRVHFRLRYDF